MSIENTEKHWFAMRDLKRWNAKDPAYKVLEEMGLEVYTPMRWTMTKSPTGAKTWQKTPVMQTVLFVNESRAVLDEVIKSVRLLQFIYRKGAGQNVATMVDSIEMERFINATAGDESTIYYSPTEITPEMKGKKVIVSGGPLDRFEGNLLKSQGSRKKRIIVEIKDFLAAAVEIAPEQIRSRSALSSDTICG